MVLKPCAAQGESIEVEDAAEPMEEVFNSYLRKRKAEFDPEEEEESDGENEEEGGDGKAKIEAKYDILKAPEWDVDSFDGLEYYSSPDPILSSDDERYDEESLEHTRIYKRHMIESKGFYTDPELKPSYYYNRIRPFRLEQKALKDKNFGQFWEDMVHVCLQKLNQEKGLNVKFVEVVRGYYLSSPRSKSYITFMAKETPDGLPVEYQAKCMVTVDRKRHPILCRPTSTPKP
ncbi:hypothetical protein V5N11_031722 [Cardamine amara subsp. amara]|uniref:Uncharacterized protein n=1 Tax=Cardamine amara subsp. amara TaxID=228776 RepID=A0ABD0Z0V4_CARAN